MKLSYNRNDEKEMKTFMGFESAHILMKKRIDFMLAVTQPTELSMLTTNNIHNSHT